MWNPKVINTDKVLYVAIADAIERDILLGILQPDEKMPPQRRLAKIIGVNLTTITRAYKEAEKRGLISGTVGRGTYVMKSRGSSNLPDILDSRDEILEFGLVGSLKVEGYSLADIMKAAADDEVMDSLSGYVQSQGLLRHREAAAAWVRQYGLEAASENMVICAGATHAFNCCLLGLFEPEDRIAVDVLTFTGFKEAAALNHIKLEPVAMDEYGMVPESLENLCTRYKIKGIYLMPNMQNPTASVMNQDRKGAIAEIILEHDLILIEDDIYNFTNLKGRTALSSLVPENGIFICGISKALFPGLRIAFTKVPERFLYKFTRAVANTVWMAPPISAELVTRLIEVGTAGEIINKKKQIIAHRLDIAREILRGFNFQAAEGSMFLWLNLPEWWNYADFENVLLLNRIRVIPADKFYVGPQTPPNAVRISLGAVRSDEELAKGLNIVIGILKQHPFAESPVM